MRPKLKAVWDENFQVYGAQKLWRELRNQGEAVARCTVERLMRGLGLRGAVRGRPVRTTIPSARPCPLDQVNRDFSATRPNRLWVADFTYVSTWQGHAFVAFVIDVFNREIVGWRATRSQATPLVLDALEQALCARGIGAEDDLIPHSDRGSQYLSICYTERLKEAGIEPSVGSVGDSYDNALAESVIGLFKTELTHRRGPWKRLQDLEYATLEWVSWYNRKRLHSALGYLSPMDYVSRYHQHNRESAMAA